MPIFAPPVSAAAGDGHRGRAARRGRAHAVRWISLASTLASLLLATVLAFQFASRSAGNTDRRYDGWPPFDVRGRRIKLKTQEPMLPLAHCTDGTVIAPFSSSSASMA